MTDPELIQEFATYVRSRPKIIQDLIRDWPPFATVKTKPGVTLLIPAPGIEGRIESYFENGRLGIVAPMTLPHPIHGWGDGEPGMPLKAEVDPDALELVAEGMFTRADVAEALQEPA